LYGGPGDERGQPAIGMAVRDRPAPTKNPVPTGGGVVRPHSPVAKLLVKRAAKQASSTRDLYEQLAAHIDDPQSRQRFTAAVEELSEPRARPPWARVAPARGSQWAV
jgi:hypothetical protein